MMGVPSTSEHAAAFHPFCPHCRYDLSNLPDGPCPECGTPFTLDALKLAHARRWRPDPRAAAHAAIWTFCWFVVALVLKIALDRGPLEPHAGEIIFLWIWMSLAWVVRREIATAPIAAFMLTFVPAVGCTMIASHIEPTELNPLGFARVPILLFAGLTALLLLWATTPGRRARCIGSAWAGAICGFGLPVMLIALLDLANHRVWSPWPDLRWWQPYINYPFTNEEAAWMGTMITALGAAAALCPTLLSRRRERPT